jgi:DNA-binding LacI/PurR family transcriptional regulator
MKSVNIQDIAREGGVGKATVSRVINGKGYVSRETAAKVRAVMERYHYSLPPWPEACPGRRATPWG